MSEDNFNAPPLRAPSPFDLALAGAEPPPPAASEPEPDRDPTPQEAAHARHAEVAIQDTVKQMRSTWVKLAGQLYEFARYHHWRALGYRSFERWLASPEIELSRRHVYHLIEVWRELVVERKVKPEDLARANYSKIREVMPAVRRGAVQVDEALSDAETLSRDDVHERYSGLGRPGADLPPSQRPIDPAAEPEWSDCPTCGRPMQVRAA